MSFVFLKFLHIALMFFGVALAIGPTALIVRVLRSGHADALRATTELVKRIYLLSTVCYGLGIIVGIAAALTGSIELTAPWLVAAYVLVAILGIHGILADNWTKQAARSLAAGVDPETLQRHRAPTYYVSAMSALVVAIVFVMVTKLAF